MPPTITATSAAAGCFWLDSWHKVRHGCNGKYWKKGPNKIASCALYLARQISYKANASVMIPLESLDLKVEFQPSFVRVRRAPVVCAGHCTSRHTPPWPLVQWYIGACPPPSPDVGGVRYFRQARLLAGYF